MNNMVAKITLDNEPRSYSEAVTGSEGQKWLTAIGEELSALESMQTWVVVRRPPDADEITAYPTGLSSDIRPASSPEDSTNAMVWITQKFLHLWLEQTACDFSCHSASN